MEKPDDEVHKFDNAAVEGNESCVKGDGVRGWVRDSSGAVAGNSVGADPLKMQKRALIMCVPLLNL